MKKSLLKASLICLGVTLLCGLYSFKTIEGEKSQHIMKKSFVESELSGCKCRLCVKDGSDGDWVLYLYNDCSKNVKVTFTYYIYKLNGEIESKPITDKIYSPGRNFIDNGVKSEELCCPGGITACLTDEEPQE